MEVHLLLSDSQVAQAESLLLDAINSGQLARMLAASGLPLDFLGLGSSLPPGHTASWLAPALSAQQTAPVPPGAAGGSDRDAAAIVGGVLGGVIALLLAGTILGRSTDACQRHASLMAGVALLLSMVACIIAVARIPTQCASHVCIPQNFTNAVRCCRCF